MVKLIACRNLTGAIGKNNNLMYHLPKDLKYFKEKTKDSIVIMGYNTFKSLPKFPLPDRVNIVIADEPNDVPECENVVVKEKLRDAIDYAKGICCKDIYVIGGAFLFSEAIRFAEELEITDVQDYSKGDVHFPVISHLDWKLVETKEDEDNDCKLIFNRYVRNNIENNNLIKLKFKRNSLQDDLFEEWISNDGKFKITCNVGLYKLEQVTSNINSSMVTKYLNLKRTTKLNIIELENIVKYLYF